MKHIWVHNDRIYPHETYKTVVLAPPEPIPTDFVTTGVGILNCKKDYCIKRQETGANYSFIVVMEGAMQLKYDGKTYILTKGQGALLRLSAYHEYTAWHNQDFQYAFMNLTEREGSPALRSIYDTLCEKGFGPVKLTKVEEVQALVKKIMNLATAGELRSFLQIYVYTLQVLTNLVNDRYMEEEYRSRLYMPVWCKELMTYMQEFYYLKIDFGAFCRDHFVNQTLCSREFKRLLGVSPNRFLTNIRLNKAKLYLTGTDKTLDSIAGETGFSSTSRFIEKFKEQNQMTPAKYRALYKV